MTHPLLTRLRLFWLERIKPDELQRTLFIAAFIGVGGALATVGFREALALMSQLLFGQSEGMVRVAQGLLWWQRMLYPMAGGILAGLVLQALGRWVKGGSGQDYMEAIALGDGHIGVRAALMRAASSALTVVSGSSIGREASMVQLSALVGALFGRFRQASRPRRRLLVACGAAAGISAAYNAPIAGALFVAEIILQSFTIESLAPLLVASIVSNLVVHQFIGFGPIYHMPAFELHLGFEAGAYALLGVLAGLLAPLFLLLLRAARRPYACLQVPLWVKLGLGGLIVGLISVLEPAVWGNGYSVVNSVLQGGWAWQALLAIFVFKVLATAAATGSGAVGGVFTPTLFVGAVLGALFSIGLHLLWPGASPEPAYIATGMAAFLAACSHAPLMAAMMIFEMTKNYDVIAPLMLASVLAYLVKRALMRKSIYAHSLPDPQTDAFAALRAEALLRAEPPTVLRSAPLLEIEQAFVRSRWQHVYLVDAGGRFVGAASLHDFGPWLRQQASAEGVLPEHLVKHDYPRVLDSASLGKVLEAFSGHSGERLPVLAENGVLRGYVSKTDLMLVLQESVG